MIDDIDRPDTPAEALEAAETHGDQDAARELRTLHPAPDPDSAVGHRFDIVLGEAMDAFWEKIADGYPEVKTGDLDPLSDHQFRASAEVVLRAWLWSNIPALDETWEATHRA